MGTKKFGHDLAAKNTYPKNKPKKCCGKCKDG